MNNSTVSKIPILLDSHREEIEKISEQGPTQEDFPYLSRFFKIANAALYQGTITANHLTDIYSWFNGSMDTDQSLQGHACTTPHGYHGDFEIIDKIYRNHVSDSPKFARWDIFLQNSDACQAVRNRKKYLKEKLNNLPKDACVLNLASGPCRDIAEFLRESGKKISFHCVDLDAKAICFAKTLLNAELSDHVTFSHSNVLTYRPKKKYDLIWSAGLFDYLDDVKFVRMLEKFKRFIKPGGNLIVGNFQGQLKSRDYMEFAGWKLIYRDSEHLLALASAAGLEDARVEYEELEVNLFLNFKNL